MAASFLRRNCSLTGERRAAELHPGSSSSVEHCEHPPAPQLTPTGALPGTQAGGGGTEQDHAGRAPGPCRTKQAEHQHHAGPCRPSSRTMQGEQQDEQQDHAGRAPAPCRIPSRASGRAEHQDHAQGPGRHGRRALRLARSSCPWPSDWPSGRACAVRGVSFPGAVPGSRGHGLSVSLWH